MRQRWMCVGLLASALAFAAIPRALADDAEHPKGEHAHRFKEYKGKDVKHADVTFDVSDPKQAERLAELVKSGEIAELEGVEPLNPLAILWDLGLWTIVIFCLLLIILRKAAWDPLLTGLKKREETIKNSVEEAKKARAETERISAEFKVKMDQAY